MKKVNQLFLMLICVMMGACGKDDVVNPEDTLFRRLSRGKGIWTIVSIKDYNILPEGASLVEEINPDGQYIFYLNSEFVGGVEISLNTLAAVVKEGENVSVFRYLIHAEWERFTIYTDPLEADAVYTVVENSRDTQVWTRYEVNYETQETTMREITLEYCPNCEPIYPEIVEQEI
ncbi:MAG: hypothetical protein ACK57W_03270 [Flavobacteriales bacterium]